MLTDTLVQHKNKQNNEANTNEVRNGWRFKIKCTY